MEYKRITGGIRLWKGADQCDIVFFQPDILRVTYCFDGEQNHCKTKAVVLAETDRCPEIRLDSETALHFAMDGVVVEIDADPLAISVRDAGGRLIHQDLAGKAYWKDPNNRRYHFFRQLDFGDFYGLGEKSGELNKKGRRLRMDAFDAMGYNSRTSDPLYKHIPFLIKRNRDAGVSCGVFYDSPYTGSFDLGCEHSNYWPRHAYFTCDGGMIDYYLILGNTLQGVVRRYTDLTGKTAMQPLSTMGFMGSTMYYTEQERAVDNEIVGFVQKMHEHGLGCDGFHLSSGYTAKDGKRYVFHWNRERFPEPAVFTRAMKAQGALVSPNVKPAMLLTHPLYREFAEAGAFLMDSARLAPHTEMFWGGLASLVDFSAPAGRRLWKKYMIERLLANGITGIWDDNNEYELTAGNPTCDNDGAPVPARSMRPLMSMLMAQTARSAYEEYAPGLRPYILSRAGYAGIQRYAQTWAGDNRTDWQSLRYNIPVMLGMGLSGVANQGCDVGGFDGPAPEGELFVRWVQNGIFQPRFCIHSQNDDHTVTLPWAYHSYLPQLRQAFRLRYQLSLYLYSLLWQAHVQGDPIMRPLVYAFENDPCVADESFAFMYGPSLLVNHVLEPKADAVKVYLPAGTDWYDYHTHQRFKGGQTIVKAVELSTIPLFYPCGAILPTVEAALCSRVENFARVRLLIECSVSSSFTLYQDDGVSNQFEKGEYRETKIDMRVSARDVSLCFTHAGSYATVTETYELTLVGLSSAPASVQAADEELALCLDKESFDASERCFWYDLDCRHLNVKLPNPKQDFSVSVQKGLSIYGS